ncbi:hypothetical protein DPB93_19310 [Salmonella enterica subsp. salamae]|nr:DUF2645 family protein [Salmonella enterica subsp. salamae]ECI4077750.1 hypothetical protein [Salmonella enterica subsp. salamae]EEO2383328.1 YjeO family protein [Salmonella enterica]
MSPKMFALCSLWFLIAVPLIWLFSIQDKEWMIGEGEINNICELMRTVENDDTRDVSIIMTLPLFFPFFYAFLYKRKRCWYLYCVTFVMVGFWLWQFFLRYQFCL